MPDEPKLVVKSELPQDRTGARTMFDPAVSRWEILWRNMIAGFGRALGGTIIYAAFLLIVGGIISQVVYPIVKPYLDAYLGVLNGFNQLNNRERATPEPSVTIQTREGASEAISVDELLSNPKVQNLLEHINP